MCRNRELTLELMSFVASGLSWRWRRAKLGYGEKNWGTNPAGGGFLLKVGCSSGQTLHFYLEQLVLVSRHRPSKGAPVHRRRSGGSRGRGGSRGWKDSRKERFRRHDLTILVRNRNIPLPVWCRMNTWYVYYSDMFRVRNLCTEPRIDRKKRKKNFFS